MKNGISINISEIREKYTKLSKALEEEFHAEIRAIANHSEDYNEDGEHPVEEMALRFSIENLNVDDYYSAFNYIRHRCCGAEHAYRQVLEALYQVGQKHGKDSSFYKSLEKEAERLFLLSDFTWSKIIYTGNLNTQFNGGKNLRMVINLVDFFQLKCDEEMTERIEELRQLTKQFEKTA